MMHSIPVWTCGAALALALHAFAQEPLKTTPKSSTAAEIKQRETDLQAHNVARPSNGAQVSLRVLEKAVKDPNTKPEDTFDGTPNSRCVVTGVPYVFRVELMDKFAIKEINFMLEKAETCARPLDLEVTLSDGTVLKKTLENLRPTKENPYPRQTLPVGKELTWFEVKVVSIEPGKDKDGNPVMWGGMGEIEAITTADLHPYLDVPDWNAAMATYIQGGTPRNDYSNVRVNMPAKIGLEGHPRIYMSRTEIVKWREEIKKTERGRKAIQDVLNVAGGPLNQSIVMPDPKVPAQLNDRFDAAAKAHDELSINAGRMAWAYQLTDNEAYAAKVREILLGYAKLYPNDYVEHKGANPNDTAKVMAQRLSEAMWLLPLIQAYDMIYDSKCMTDADRKLIENDLLRTAITFIHDKRDAATDMAQRDKQNPKWRTEEPTTGGKAMGNWVNFYNAAFIQAGIAIGDQNWIDIGAADTRMMIARGIGDDGMWKEGAIGYQNFARQALIACMEPLARQGIDIYGSNQARVKNLFDSAYKYTYPDGTMPGINDSGRDAGSDFTLMAYDYGWLRYGDPNYGAAVNASQRQIFQSTACYFPTVIYEKLPEKPMQGLTSVIFDGLGYAIMRGNDRGGPTYLLMKTSKSTGGPHDHPDKLNLIIFADGDELCGEPQFYRYEDNRHPGWTKTTIGHYTLAVGEHNQAIACDSRLIAFYDAGKVKVMRGQCLGAYPGVGLDRTVVQMPGYIVDVYRAWGPTMHTYDYPLCFRGKLSSLEGVDIASLKPMSQSSQGYDLFRTQPPVRLQGDWSGVWNRPEIPAVPASEGQEAKTGNPANQVNVTVLGDGETSAFTGIGPDDRQKAILRRTGKSAVFSAVIDPFKGSKAIASVEQLKIEGPVPAYGVKVKRADGGTDLIVVRFDAQKDGKPAAASTFTGGSTDSLVSVVRLDAKGKVMEAGMIGGTSLSSGSKALTLPEPGIKWEK